MFMWLDIFLLNPQQPMQKAAQFLVSCGATSFTSKNSATISPPSHFNRKLPGAFGEPTKNAPAIANVRVLEVRRKKKFAGKIQRRASNSCGR
jgi:hypothetical protein